MKIAYLIHWNEGPASGVFKKVNSQISEWSRLGHEVALFVYTNNPTDTWHLHTGLTLTFVHRYDGWRSRFTEIAKLGKQIERWNPDTIYHRFDLYYPSLHRLLKKFPSVLEINTNDVTEMQLDGGWRYGYHLLTRALILKAGKGCIFVSKELSEQKHYRKHVKSHLVIGNGIELEKIPYSAAPSNPSARFVFIGSAGQTWHGIDKMVQLAKRQITWIFDVIGLDQTEVAGDVPVNMRFHGKLTSSEYEPIMRQADIAIGTLALHRKQMVEASPLKVREYLAYGIPVITGYSETDFPQDTPFILELPNESDNIEPHLQRIIHFTETWSGKRVPRESIRHLDTKVKEALRLSFMTSLSLKGGGL